MFRRRGYTVKWQICFHRVFGIESKEDCLWSLEWKRGKKTERRGVTKDVRVYNHNIVWEEVITFYGTIYPPETAKDLRLKLVCQEGCLIKNVGKTIVDVGQYVKLNKGSVVPHQINRERIKFEGCPYTLEISISTEQALGVIPEDTEIAPPGRIRSSTASSTIGGAMSVTLPATVISKHHSTPSRIIRAESYSSSSTSPIRHNFDLEVIVIRGENIANKHMFFGSAPYVQVTCNDQILKTHRRPSKKEVHWNQSLIFKGPMNEHTKVKVEVKDHNGWGQTLHIGKVAIITKLPPMNQSRPEHYILDTGEGTVEVALHWVSTPVNPNRQSRTPTLTTPTQTPPPPRRHQHQRSPSPSPVIPIAWSEDLEDSRKLLVELYKGGLLSHEEYEAQMAILTSQALEESKVDTNTLHNDQNKNSNTILSNHSSWQLLEQLHHEGAMDDEEYTIQCNMLRTHEITMMQTTRRAPEVPAFYMDNEEDAETHIFSVVGIGGGNHNHKPNGVHSTSPPLNKVDNTPPPLPPPIPPPMENAIVKDDQPQNKVKEENPALKTSSDLIVFSTPSTPTLTSDEQNTVNFNNDMMIDTVVSHIEEHGEEQVETVKHDITENDADGGDDIVPHNDNDSTQKYEEPSDKEQLPDFTENHNEDHEVKVRIDEDKIEIVEIIDVYDDANDDPRDEGELETNEELIVDIVNNDQSIEPIAVKIDVNGSIENHVPHEHDISLVNPCSPIHTNELNNSHDIEDFPPADPLIEGHSWGQEKLTYPDQQHNISASESMDDATVSYRTDSESGVFQFQDELDNSGNTSSIGTTNGLPTAQSCFHSMEDITREQAETVTKITYDISTNKWAEEEWMIYVWPEPFAEGNLRQCYAMVGFKGKGEGQEGRELHVGKLSKDPNEDSTVYFKDVETQAMAMKLATFYNEKHPPKAISFLPAYLVRLNPRDASPSKFRYMHVEPYLPGEYKKHNNNHGFVEYEDRNTPQAFSHFTYHYTDGKYMVVDIQGVGDVFTDPQVHSRDGKGFGIGNLGTEGFQRFFETHHCNSICKMLGLPATRYKIMDCGTVANPKRSRSPSPPPVTMPLAVVSTTEKNPKQRTLLERCVERANLDPTQVQALEGLFKNLDSKNTGYISKTALLPFLKSLGIEVSTNQARDMVRNLSSCDNLDFPHFLCWWKGVEVPSEDEST